MGQTPASRIPSPVIAWRAAGFTFSMSSTVANRIVDHGCTGGFDSLGMGRLKVALVDFVSDAEAVTKLWMYLYYTYLAYGAEYPKSRSYLPTICKVLIDIASRLIKLGSRDSRRLKQILNDPHS